jgi:hypothetical protein
MNSSKQKPLQPTAEEVEGDGLGGTNATVPGTMESKSSSTWFALRNPVFFRLWLATLLSGTFVSSQDVTATWLTDYLGASQYLLSLCWQPLPPSESLPSPFLIESFFK